MTHPRARQAETEREARRAAVVELLLSGVRDQSTIAARFGVDRSTISRDIKEIEARWRKTAAADIAAIKGRDADRIEALIAAAWTQATNGDLAAITVVRELLKRLAEMYGYDAPDKIDLTGGMTSRIELVGVAEGEI